jgi:hypothetical protein
MSGSRRPKRSSTLDPRAAEAAVRFVRVLARAGGSAVRVCGKGANGA